MAATINSTGERLELGDSIDLYEIDLTPLGYATKLRWTPSRQDGGSVWFGGQEYISAVVEITGTERSSENAPPEPVLMMSNVDKGAYALLRDYDDLINAKITYMHTWGHFLDFLADGVTPNPNKDPKATNVPEIWYVQQKDGSDPTIVKWRLSSVLDLNGIMIPARTMLKTICRRPYRFWDTKKGQWVYPKTAAACPYAGADMYTATGAKTTDPAKDRCPKDPNGCEARFGVRNDLPGWFFPGLQRYPQ